MSSSAAYEVATALVLRALGGLALSSLDLAKLAREAENGFVGVACGIMDQMASTFGAAGRALLLDCRSLAHQKVEIPAGLTIVVVNSGVHHALASSEYNRRRAECEEGVRILASLRAGVRSLRDVEPDDEARFFAQAPAGRPQALPPRRLRERACARGGEGVASGDNAQLKTLLAASHVSLRDDYEVSCPELDVLVDLALAHPACHGARLTGAGFGGSTVNLVDTGAVDSFSEAVAAGYRAARAARRRSTSSSRAPAPACLASLGYRRRRAPSRARRGGFGDPPGPTSGLAVDDPAAAGADVDAAGDARVADDDGAEAPLVLVVVDPHPALALVVGAEEAGHVADLADEIQRRIGLPLGRLAEAERVGLGHARASAS